MMAEPEPDSEFSDPSPTASPHPEEMRATVELRVSEHVTLRATARMTPAGLVAAALLLTAILVPVMWGMRQRRIS
jgi:hypothetical protein